MVSSGRSDDINGAPLDVVLRLLASDPHALVFAATENGMPSAVGLDVPLPRERCLVPRGLEVFSDAGLTMLVAALAEAKRAGYAQCGLRVSDPLTGFSTQTTAHVVDARADYSCLLFVFIAEDGAGFADLHSQQPKQRIARMVRDAQGVITDVDDALVHLLRRPREQFVGHRSSIFIHPDDLAVALESWVALTRTEGLGRRSRLRYRTGDGDFVWFEITSHNQLGESGEVISDLVDITSEMHAQERVAERERLLHNLAEALPLGVLLIDGAGAITYTNSRLSLVLGMDAPADVRDVSACLRRPDQVTFTTAVSDVLAGVESDVQVAVAAARGQERVCAVSLRRMSEAENEGAIVCFTEVTEAVRLRSQLEVQASHDALTGCLNRSAILDALAASAGQEDRRQRGLATVFLDLNLFKAVNDRFGHAAGDELLAIVGLRLRGLLREGDAVGRLGGDEFLVLFHNVPSAEAAQRIGDRVARLLEGDVALAAGTVAISASVGVSWIYRRRNTADRLVALADAAMYRAKRAGLRTAVLSSGSSPDAMGHRNSDRRAS